MRLDLQRCNPDRKGTRQAGGWLKQNGEGFLREMIIMS